MPRASTVSVGILAKAEPAIPTTRRGCARHRLTQPVAAWSRNGIATRIDVGAATGPRTPRDKPKQGQTDEGNNPEHRSGKFTEAPSEAWWRRVHPPYFGEVS